MSDYLTLTAYFAERDRTGNRFLADALLDLFEQRQIDTSVVLRGIAGVGPGNIVRTDRTLSRSEDPPVSIMAIDTAARITAVTDDAAALIGQGALALEPAESLVGAAPTDATVRLSLVLGRRHRIGGMPAYVTVCDVLQHHGFVSAGAYLGVDGTTAGSRHRARFFSRNAAVPLIIEGVGAAANATAAVDEVRAALGDARFTVTPAHLCKADGVTVAGPPAMAGSFGKLSVHTSESATMDGRPIHQALIQRLKASGHAGGATVLRAVWGFRGDERPHGDRFVQLARRVPVTTVVLDTAAGIAASYPIVDEVTADHGVVTYETLPGMLEIHSGNTWGDLGI